MVAVVVSDAVCVTDPVVVTDVAGAEVVDVVCVTVFVAAVAVPLPVLIPVPVLVRVSTAVEVSVPKDVDVLVLCPVPVPAPESEMELVKLDVVVPVPPGGLVTVEVAQPVVPQVPAYGVYVVVWVALSVKVLVAITLIVCVAVSDSVPVNPSVAVPDIVYVAVIVAQYVYVAGPVAVFVLLPVPVPVPVPVSPASNASPAWIAKARSLGSPVAESLLEQFTTTTAHAIAAMLLILVPIGLPRLQGGSAQSPRRQFSIKWLPAQFGAEQPAHFAPVTSGRQAPRTARAWLVSSCPGARAFASSSINLSLRHGNAHALPAEVIRS